MSEMTEDMNVRAMLRVWNRFSQIDRLYKINFKAKSAIHP